MVQFASYVRRVLHKTRLIFSHINGPIVNEHIFSIIGLLPPKKILFACKQKSKRQPKGFSNFKRKEGNEFKCFRVKLFKKETLSSLRKF